MKIIQLVTRNVIGGVQTVADILDGGLRSNGEDTSVWFFCGSEERTTPPPNSVCIFLKRPGISYYPRLLWRLYLRFLRERPDVVIAHTTNTAVPGLILAALAGIKKRIAVQHNPLDTYSKMARLMDRLCADGGIYTHNVCVANAVRLTTTHYSASALGRLRIIHNGMKLPPSETGSSESSSSTSLLRFALPHDTPLILNVGRLSDQKNQAALIEAMQSVEGAMLVIAGDGPLHSSLSDQVRASSLEHKVKLIGAVDTITVRELMRVATVVATPALFEAMPMAVLEAMQSGSAIVASDIPAHVELLADAAMIVPADPASFADAIRSLLANPDHRNHLATAVLERSKAFSEEAMVQGYLRLLRS